MSFRRVCLLEKERKCERYNRKRERRHTIVIVSDFCCESYRWRQKPFHKFFLHYLGFEAVDVDVAVAAVDAEFHCRTWFPLELSPPLDLKLRLWKEKKIRNERNGMRRSRMDKMCVCPQQVWYLTIWGKKIFSFEKSGKILLKIDPFFPKKKCLCFSMLANGFLKKIYYFFCFSCKREI